MKIGYSFWGFLGDKKMDKNFNILSTPDGNAFYSWCIIRELQRDGFTCVSIMPDRDKYWYEYCEYGRENAVHPYSEYAFGAWCTVDRTKAYELMEKTDYSLFDGTKESLYKIWLSQGYDSLSFILHEWRMEIIGRNDKETMGRYFNGELIDFQPDYFIQECLIDFCADYNIPLIIFDLDYKLSEDMFVKLLEINKETYLLELGFKWSRKYGYSTVDHIYHVEIPFDFDYMYAYPHLLNAGIEYNLIYVGNRYERDWCIDKYIPQDLSYVKVYGNWLESGRDSKDRWPNIDFGGRLQTYDMMDVYSSSVATILLAKEEYCKYSFMTARILEAIFYGTIPLFIEEYGKDTIEKYAGIYAEFLTVRNKEDVKEKINILRHDMVVRFYILKYLKNHLSFMDVRNFIKVLYNCIGYEGGRLYGLYVK